MQFKDIDEKPILFLLAENPGVCHHWWNEPGATILPAFPIEAQDQPRLIMAKMRNLLSRALVDGCACGCRGDYVITDMGIAYLKEQMRDE